MSPKKRVQQHKPRREEAHTAELQELRGEKRQLQKQVSRLRKALGKVEPVEAEPEVAAEAPKPVASCTACASTDVKSAKLPIGTLFVCTPCGARWKAAL